MGQLLSSLNLRGGDAMVPELGFDIENATPSPDELQLHNQLSSLLVQPGPVLLESLNSYSSASELIREAIATPIPENENKAWDAVLPIVDMLREFYDYAADLQDGMPRLLNVLCQGDVNKNLEKHQGLTKLFADLLDFVFEFDYLKMRNPTLQNDFSYYRRMLQRGRYSTTGRESLHESVSDLRSAMMEDDQANRISLFIAYPTPMLRCVIETTTQYVKENGLQKSVGDCLTALWAACFQTVNKKRTRTNRPEVSAFCLKVMVVSIILYDHIDPNGAFSKNSPINIKNSIKMIQTINVLNIPKESSASNLMSALRYNSKHLNDDSTPKGVKNIVMAA
ncbi:Protein fam49a [Apophysomyces sp. BC1034]|nr:Protein fam49a [Apophysomyces sp. BC1015]KAG0180016.1 Protein fam49a [Apophysomyces sp. BC1021]KAG0190552.1 Protein fam49a [Apophysomyces sp. BC1034]